MNLRESKRILREVTMACWWPSRVTGRTQEARTEIMQEATGWLAYPCEEARKRAVEEALNVYYRKG